MKILTSFVLTAASLLCIASSLAAQSNSKELLAFIGTYTRPNASKGIYAYRFQPATGKWTSIGLAAETASPSFLAVHPNRKFLYAVNEVSQYQGQPAGSVSAFSMNAANGELKLLNTVSSKGSGPCHLALDNSGKWLFVANYNGGSVAAYRVLGDGKLEEAAAFFQHAGSSVNKARQAGPHGHGTHVSRNNRFVLVPDLGLDQILIYRIDDQKGLVPHSTPFAKVTGGFGPRHLAFSPDGKFAYAVGEMTAEVKAFAFDEDKGALQELQTVSTLPADYTGNKSSAEIAVHPTGKFLYMSNRVHNSIAIFTIDPKKGTLTAAGIVPTEGKTPRNFAIDPSGSYLLAANQDSGNIITFRIDPKTGALTRAGDPVEVPSPVSIVFTPAP